METRRDLEQLKEYLVMLLADLIKRREEDNIQPCHAEMTDIQNTLMDDTKICLNALCRENMLTFHRTLNSIAFEFTPPKR